MHPFLTDPDNAKAYQTLCDCPSGSTRSWATKAGWTRSRMERFLLRLKAEGLARVERTVEGSRFLPLLSETVSETLSQTVSRYLGSTAVAVTPALDKVPRYGEAPSGRQQPIADADDIRLIVASNEILKDRDWQTISEDNRGSLAGAAKILKAVPFDRAVPLLEAAIRQFNPSATGGEPLRSLGHPFITRYVINEYRRLERDLSRGQLPLLFVERTGPSAHVYGARRVAQPQDAPPAGPEHIAAGMRAAAEGMRNRTGRS